VATIGELLGGKLPDGSKGFSIGTNPDGSRHVSIFTDGAHASWDVNQDGRFLNRHGTVQDVTGGGDHKTFPF
jgi:hypothetical protein